MADDRHYVSGDFYRICERTGFKIRANRTRHEWTGRIVRDESWERRHPQDFVRGQADPQNVPDPRPRQTDVFVMKGPTAFFVYLDNGMKQFLVERDGTGPDNIEVVAMSEAITPGSL